MTTSLPLMAPEPPREVVDHAFARAVEHFLGVVSDALALVDRDGRVVRANLAYRRLTGPAGGAHDASIISFLEPDQVEACREALHSLNESVLTRSLQLRFRIGQELRLVDAELAWLGPSDLVSFVGRDVTRAGMLERERLETAIVREAAEQVGDIGHWRVGRDFKLRCSAGASRILGLDPAAPAPLLTDLVELVLPAERGAVVAAASEAIDRHKPVNQTFRIRRSDGATRLIQVAGAPSLDQRGHVEAMHGVLIDKSDGHAALQAAMSADSVVRRFVHAAPMAVCMYDREMRVLMASQSWLSERRLREEDALGRSMYDLMPGIPDRWRRIHRQVLRGEALSHERDPFERRSGRQGWLKWSAAPWRDGDGNVGGLVIMHEDVTDFVRAQHEVETSKERMALGMSITRMMIWELDFEMRETFIEGDWKHFFAHRPTFDSLAGNDSWIHSADREMLANKWRTHLAGGAPYTAEYRVTLPDGREIWHSATVQIFRTVTGSPARAFAVTQDVTVRKTIELKAIDAEQRALLAAAARADLLADMSHEIRTPLTGVLAVSDILQRTRLDERQSEMVKLISTSGRTLLRVMDDLVEFSRLSRDDIQLEVRPFELEEMLRNTCEAGRGRAHAKGLRFETFISATCDGVFRGDPVRIGQVLGALLNNAVRTTDAGHVSVSAAIETTPDGLTQLRLSVTDTGAGFAPAVIERIFDQADLPDAARSGRLRGLGVGLSMVKRLVDVMNGQIMVRTAEGEGSTFEVTCPVSHDRIAAIGGISPPAARDPDAAAAVGNLRLLVAEDNPMNRRVIELLLAKSGLKITFAENGREALEKFSDGRFDVVLMDLQMPIMDGLTAIQAIRDWERRNSRVPTPILAVSANAADEHVIEARNAGADDHVAKPIVRETLFDAITRHAKPAHDIDAMLDQGEIDLDRFDIAV